MSSIWFAVGRCQYGARGCQEARMFGQKATIVSPDFSTPEALDAWLMRKAASPADRRCRCCNRSIAIEHFKRRVVEDDGLGEVRREQCA